MGSNGNIILKEPFSPGIDTKKMQNHRYPGKENFPEAMVTGKSVPADSLGVMKMKELCWPLVTSKRLRGRADQEQTIEMEK